MKGGIWYEEKGGRAPSGDGTVPFQSLEHCMSWKKHLRLKWERLDGVRHREMLADAGFHQRLREALLCDYEAEEAAESCSTCSSM